MEDTALSDIFPDFPRLSSLEHALNELFVKSAKLPIDLSDVPCWWLDFPLTWMYYVDRDSLGISPRWYEDNNLYRIKAAFYCYYRAIVDDISKTLRLDSDYKHFVEYTLNRTEVNETSIIIVQRWLNHIVYFREFKTRYDAFGSFDTMELMESEFQTEYRSNIGGNPLIR